MQTKAIPGQTVPVEMNQIPSTAKRTAKIVGITQRLFASTITNTPKERQLPPVQPDWCRTY